MQINGLPVKKVRLSDLVKSGYNPRKISTDQAAALQRSIQEFGMVDAIIINKNNNHVVGGHQRLDALLALGETETDVVIVELTEEREKLLNIALNKISGDWDEDKLTELLRELKASDLDVLLTGFSEKELAQLLPIVPADGLTDPDAIPEKAETRCKSGQLWKLGEHRLMCGDSKKVEDVARLMGGGKSQLCVTSPPYWIGKEYEKEKTIDEIKNFISSVSECISLAVDDNRRICLNTGIISNGEMLGYLDCRLVLDWWQDALRNFGWITRNIRIWVKHGGLASVAPAQDIVDMHWEFLATFYKKTDNYRGQNKIGKQWALLGFWDDVHREQQEIHSAPFPVELPSRFIELYSDKEEKVYDPFCGSGTTIIACERLSRKCYAMEIDEHYCDVILKRWEDFTNQQAELIE